jgi:hypothetical protein
MGPLTLFAAPQASDKHDADFGLKVSRDGRLRGEQ